VCHKIRIQKAKDAVPNARGTFTETPLHTDNITGDRRTLHNEKLGALYSSLNTILVSKSKRLKWTERAACMENMRSAYGRHKRRWENNIKMDLREVQFGRGGAQTESIWFRIGTSGGLL
jgi:hypothetical protein